MAKYTMDSKQIIEKEITHLKNAILFNTSKSEYEKLIKNKEDELKECEEWIYSNKPCIDHNIQLLEKSIEEYNHLIKISRTQAQLFISSFCQPINKLIIFCKYDVTLRHCD
jgi:hypothetical protein